MDTLRDKPWLTIGAGIVCILLIAVIGIFLFVGLSPRQVQQGSATRHLPERWTEIGNPVTVTLMLPASAIPYCLPEAKRLPMDIVLAIDSSTSMEGAPLGQAQSGARLFVEQIDLTRHQVAIAFFNGESAITQALTQNRDALTGTIAQARAQNGTRIDLALLSAQAELLGARHRPTAAGVIILFTDGGTQEPDAVFVQAQTARQAGLRVLVVGLVSRDYTPDVLNAIVASPADLVVVEKPTDLPKVYGRLARVVNQVVARQAIIEERFTPQIFQSVPGSARPASEQLPGMVRWGPTWLTEDGVNLVYQVQPTAWGWLDVSNGKGLIALTDCQDILQQWDGVVGPGMLVLPFAPWVPVLALLPLLFLVLMSIFNWRRSQPIVSPAAPRAVPTIPAIVQPADITKEWITRVQPLDMTETPPQEMTEALIIGMGETGRWVLTQIKKNLADRFQGQMPAQVRLLLIELRQPSTVADIKIGGIALQHEKHEILKLYPDFDAIDKTAKKDSAKYFRWWRATSGEPTRAMGRGAIFYDTHQERRLNRALSRAFDGLKMPNVFFVGSLSDPVGSGMIWDVAYRAAQVYKQITGKDLPRRLAWFSLPDVETHVEDEQAQNQRFAALRELQRISFKGALPFIYGTDLDQRNLVGTTDTTLVDLCFLFDSIAERNALDLSDLKPAEGLPVIMADILTMILDPVVWGQFREDLGPILTNIGTIAETTSEALVSSMGGYLYKLPVEDLRRVAEARFVFEILFGEQNIENESKRKGLFVRMSGEQKNSGLGTAPTALPLDPRIARQEPADPAMLIQSFLNGTNLKNQHNVFKAFASILSDRSVPETQLDGAHADLENFFRAMLYEQLLRILNGEGEQYAVARSGKLAYTELFLDRLSKRLPDIQRHFGGNVEFRDTQIEDRISLLLNMMQEIVRQTQSEVRAWTSTLIGYTGTVSSTTAQFAPPTFQSAQTVAQITLCERAEQGWQNAKHDLEHLRRVSEKSKTRRVFLSTEIEQSLYLKYLRPDLKRGPHIGESGAQDPIARALQRIGWHWEESEGHWRLNLVVLPPQFANTQDWQAHQIHHTDLRKPQGIEALYETMSNLARVFSRALAENERVVDYLEEERIGVGEIVERLEWGLAPLVRCDPTAITDVIYGAHQEQYKRYLTLADDVLNAKIKDRISQVSLFAGVSHDPYTCGLLKARHFVPVTRTEDYQHIQEQYLANEISYVFPAEQEAVRCEKILHEQDETVNADGSRLFHPFFVRLLENEDLAELFGACVLYDWVKREKLSASEWQFQILLAGVDPIMQARISGATPLWSKAMEKFALSEPMTSSQVSPMHWSNRDKTVKRIEEALNQIRSSRERNNLLKQQKDFINHLAGHPNKLEQNFAAYLRVIFERERDR